MNAMGQSLALALAPHGIFVGTVAPGFVTTDRVAHRLDGPDGENIRRQSPLGRVATPDEVAYAVAFLASDRSSWTTGQVLFIEGGILVKA
jgi:NAD(P)-dependent dehydrogenase (short-subunit alcohol dehydrogenase family)